MYTSLATAQVSEFTRAQPLRQRHCSALPNGCCLSNNDPEGDLTSRLLLPADDYERGITGNSGNRVECPTSAMTAATCSSTSATLMVYISRPLSYPLSAACFK